MTAVSARADRECSRTRSHHCCPARCPSMWHLAEAKSKQGGEENVKKAIKTRNFFLHKRCMFSLLHIPRAAIDRALIAKLERENSELSSSFNNLCDLIELLRCGKIFFFLSFFRITFFFTLPKEIFSLTSSLQNAFENFAKISIVWSVCTASIRLSWGLLSVFH